MKHYLPLLTAMTSFCLVAPLVANNQFNRGIQQGSASKGQGASTIRGFKPAEVIPGYVDSPAENGYYGSVTSSGTDMTSPGSTALNTSEVGKTITESILNTPPDNRPSLDAPSISEGLAVRDRVEAITGDGLNGCVNQPASSIEITTHQYLRDTKIKQYCTHTATITGDWKDTEVYRYVTISPGQFRHSQSGRQLVFSVTSPVTDVVMNTQLRVYSGFYFLNSRYTFMNSVFNVGTIPDTTDTFTLSDMPRLNITEGQVLVGSGCTANGNCIDDGNGNWQVYQSLANEKSTFALTMYVRINEREWVSWVEWSENCPSSKTEGAVTGLQYMGPGGTRTVVAGGKTYSVHQDCWKWRGTYLTQTGTEGTCEGFIRNPACTMARGECADAVNGFYVSQQVTYSCECKKEGSSQICGGEFFCKSGSYAQAQTGTSNMFGQAVSTLAVVAVAGKDVAALNGVDARAFTGGAQHYKKMAVGFDNCCKDFDWGQDVGLSDCSSEEKALGKAKDRKPMVYVGEYCSKRMLSVYLEEKRGYCVFDSKLARVVQEQGRRDQLGVGFGKGKSPDYRNVMVNELQRLDFDVMNFSGFYGDLNAGSEIPKGQALLEKAQDIIIEKMQENAP